MKIEVIHQSDMNAYANFCPRYLYLSRVQERIPVWRSPKALAGSVIHKALDLLKDVPLPDFGMEVADVWDFAWKWVAENPHFPNEKDVPIRWYPNEQEQFGKIRSEGIRMLRGFVNNCPAHKVILSEYDFKIKIGRFDFAGTIDQLWETAQGIVLVDFKSGQMLPKDDTIQQSYQFALYALALTAQGYTLDAFAWYHLRDHLPYEKLSYKDSRKNDTNEAMLEWITANGRQVIDRESKVFNGKYAFTEGMDRGPGLYAYPVSLGWLNTRESLLLAGAGAIALANPVPIISQSCERCGFRTVCRALLDKKTITEEQLKQYQINTEEENA